MHPDLLHNVEKVRVGLAKCRDVLQACRVSKVLRTFRRSKRQKVTLIIVESTVRMHCLANGEVRTICRLGYASFVSASLG